MDAETIDKIRMEANTMRKQLQALDSVLAVYDAPSQEGNSVELPIKPSKKGGRRAGQGARIEEACKNAIQKNEGRAITTKNLLQELESIGIVIGGLNPTSNLAAKLSQSDNFESEGRSVGWKLVKNEAPLQGPQSFAGSPQEVLRNPR